MTINQIKKQIEEMKKEAKVFGIDFTEQIAFYEEMLIDKKIKDEQEKEFKKVAKKRAEEVTSRLDWL